MHEAFACVRSLIKFAIFKCRVKIVYRNLFVDKIECFVTAVKMPILHIVDNNIVII